MMCSRTKMRTDILGSRVPSSMLPLRFFRRSSHFFHPPMVSILRNSRTVISPLYNWCCMQCSYVLSFVLVSGVLLHIPYTHYTQLHTRIRYAVWTEFFASFYFSDTLFSFFSHSVSIRFFSRWELYGCIIASGVLHSRVCMSVCV